MCVCVREKKRREEKRNERTPLGCAAWRSLAGGFLEQCSNPNARGGLLGIPLPSPLWSAPLPPLHFFEVVDELPGGRAALSLSVSRALPIHDQQDFTHTDKFRSAFTRPKYKYYKLLLLFIFKSVINFTFDCVNLKQKKKK